MNGQSRARQLTYVPLDRLRFDPENPRFPPSRHGGSEAEAFQYLLSQANLLDLMASIAAQDFFPGEPLLVTDNGDSTFTVVEGNRRLAACRLLQDPTLAPTRTRSVQQLAESADFRPTELPALVFDDRDDILQFLGYRHISGIQEWSPLAKARYVEQLWAKEVGSAGDTAQHLRNVARRIGSKADYVARLLTTHRFFEHARRREFFGLALDEESIAFSLLLVAFSRPPIVNFLGLSSGRDMKLAGIDERRSRELLDWLFVLDRAGQTRLGESRNMRLLAAIVDDEKALRAFREGVSLQESYLLAVFADDAISNNLFIAHEQLVSALRQLDSGHEARLEDLATARTVRALSETLITKIEGQPSA